MKTLRISMVVTVILLFLFSSCWALDSLNVRRLGSCLTGEQAFAVALSGNYAYVANDDSGIRVIDISNLSTPFITGRYNDPTGTSNWAQGLFIRDTLLYEADRGGGLRILSIANPTTPTPVTNIGPSGSIRGVFVRDTIAYLAADASGLLVIGLRNPAQPHLIGSLTMTQSYSVKVVDSIAYVANLSGGLGIVNISRPTAPVLLSTLAAVGSERIIDVFVDSNKAYLANANSRIQRIVDVTNPRAPAYIDSIVLDTARSVVKMDTLLFYGSADSGINIVSYVSGSHPIRQGYNHRMGTAAFNYGRGVAVRDSTVFLACDQGGLVIYNYGALLNQQWIRVLNPSSRDTLRSRSFTTIRWTSNNVFDSVRIELSRANPISWQPIGTAAVADTRFTWRVYNPYNLVNTPCLIRVVSMDDQTIIGTSQQFYIRAPAVPLSITSPVGGEVWPIGTNHTIRWLHGDSTLVYVGILRNGISTRFDTTSADSFVWTVSGDTCSQAYIRVQQVPDSFYSALSQPIVIQMNAAGDPVVPLEFRLHAAYPNPFNATTTIRYTVPSATKLKVEVFDIRGASVYESAQKLSAPGTYSIALNGERWSSGVYFVRIQAGTHHGMMKVVLLK